MRRVVRCYIYILLDPRTGAVRYVGKANTPSKRLSAHLYTKDEYHRSPWIARLRALGLKPTMVVVERVTQWNWHVRERYWIKHYRAQGAKLLNASGGVVNKPARQLHWELVNGEYVAVPNSNRAPFTLLLSTGQKVFVWGGKHTTGGYYYITIRRRRIHIPKSSRVYNLEPAYIPWSVQYQIGSSPQGD